MMIVVKLLSSIISVSISMILRKVLSQMLIKMVINTPTNTTGFDGSVQTYGDVLGLCSHPYSLRRELKIALRWT